MLTMPARTLLDEYEGVDQRARNRTAHATLDVAQEPRGYGVLAGSRPFAGPLIHPDFCKIRECDRVILRRAGLFRRIKPHSHHARTLLQPIPVIPGTIYAIGGIVPVR